MLVVGGPVLRLVALAAVFVVAAALGVALSREAGNVAVFWPANAVLLGALLRGTHWRPGPAIGACGVANVAFNLVYGDTLPIAVGFGCANMAEVVAAYGLIRSWTQLPLTLAGMGELLLLLAAGTGAPVLGAFLGASLVSYAFATPFWSVWRNWWIGDAVGILLLVPLLISYDRSWFRRLLQRGFGPWRLFELLLATTVVTGQLWWIVRYSAYASPALFTPVLLWFALRFGVGTTTMASAAICLAAIKASLLGAWPLPYTADGSLAGGAASLQLFLVLTSLPPLVVAVVVAERERARAALAASEERYRLLIDTAPDAILVHSEGRIVLANRQAATVLGAAEPAALIGRPALGHVHPDGAAVARRRTAGLRQPGDRAEPIELPFVRVDGMRVEVEAAAAAVSFDARPAVQAVFRDITERKRLERELTEAKRRLDDALESMADGCVLYDGQERFVLCNQRYLDFFPYSADLRVAGAYLRDIWREEARRGIYRDIDPSNVEAWMQERRAKAGTDVHEEIEFADGRWLQFRAAPTAEGGTIVVARDVTERRRLEQELAHRALHDPLTGLPNRALFHRELEQARARVERQGGSRRLGVLLIDLDGFKQVNDLHGHETGDRLLVEVATRLRQCVREGDTAVRLGGDEFAVIAESDGEQGLEALAERIVLRLAAPLQLDTIELEPGGSVGLTVFPDDPSGPDELLAHADRALYAAKAAGRRTWALFEQGTRSQVAAGGAGLATGLGAALERGEMDLDYQPIVALDTLEVVAVEALLRWEHPAHGRLPAAGFIAAAQDSRVILPLTRHVLDSALRQQQAWRHEGVADLRVCVNLAPRCLRWEGLVDAVAASLAGSDAAPDRLVLEVGEDALADLAPVGSRVRALRLLGVDVALDGFGASSVSLSRLRRLPLSLLKIDRGFIADLAREERDRAILRTIVALGRNLGLKPTAHGIETAEQLAILRRLGCVWGQGFLFARPMPAAALSAWLEVWAERRRIGPTDDLLRLEGRHLV